MENLINTRNIVSGQSPVSAITEIGKSGFSNCELDFDIYYSRYLFQNCSDDKLRNAGILWQKDLIGNQSLLEDYLRKFTSCCLVNRLLVQIAKAPHVCVDDCDSNLLLNVVSLCIKESTRIGFKYLVVQPIFSSCSSDKQWKENIEYFVKLSNLAKEQQINLLIENQCRRFNGRYLRGFLSDATDITRFVNEVNEVVGTKVLYVCFDIGAATLCGQNINDQIWRLKDLIKVVRVRDCDGQIDCSMVPFMSHNITFTTDWLSVVRGLRKIDFKGPMVYEISSTVNSYPTMLRKSLLDLTYDTASYLDWVISLENKLNQYSNIILFGAGKMCSNFIEYYGKFHKPLFICDNNKSLWGTTINNIEIKNPETLKYLPEDCCVFICNMYYTEIELQLKNMGVKNIQFFNDEFLPPKGEGNYQC